jgi:SNF2 family DNA or RNA helicase
VCSLSADCRWAVTGTPIQNRLSEIFSLIHFLRLDPYCDKLSFDKCITNPWRRGEEGGLQALAKLLRYIMLRRPKGTVELPLREDHRRFLSFDDHEQSAYDALKQTAIACLQDTLDSSPREGYRNALEKITALRDICELGCFPKPEVRLVRELRSGSSSKCASPPLSATADDDEDITSRSATGEWDAEELDHPFIEVFPQTTASELNCSILLDSTRCSPWPLAKWPTKTRALVEDITSCPTSTKRYDSTKGEVYQSS